MLCRISPTESQQSGPERVGDVRAGMGVAVLPGWAVTDEPSLVRLRFATLGRRRQWRAVVQRSRAS